MLYIDTNKQRTNKIQNSSDNISQVREKRQVNNIPNKLARLSKSERERFHPNQKKRSINTQNNKLYLKDRRKYKSQNRNIQAGKPSMIRPYKSINELYNKIFRSGPNLYKIAPGSLLKFKYRRNKRPNNIGYNIEQLKATRNRNLITLKNNNALSKKFVYNKMPNKNIYDVPAALARQDLGIEATALIFGMFVFIILAGIGEGLGHIFHSYSQNIYGVENELFNIIL